MIYLDISHKKVLNNKNDGNNKKGIFADQLKTDHKIFKFLNFDGF